MCECVVVVDERVGERRTVTNLVCSLQLLGRERLGDLRLALWVRLEELCCHVRAGVVGDEVATAGVRGGKLREVVDLVAACVCVSVCV